MRRAVTFLAAMLAFSSCWLAACRLPEPVAPSADSSLSLQRDQPVKNRCEPLAWTNPTTVNRAATRARLPDSARVSIERPAGLSSFFEALAQLARGTRHDHVRIAVFGDSNLTLDFTSGYLRRNLQTRFGDGGHGFVALGRPWSHYRHMDVRHDVISGWRSYSITTSPTGDGLYGLAGIAVENQWQGAKTFVATAEQGAPVGGSAEIWRIYSLARRRGGAFEAQLDNRPTLRVETNTDTPHLIETVIETVPGAHTLALVSASPSVVRVFGVALETKRPGVVVDSFGVGSLNTKTLAKNDPALVREMLESRDYDLIVHWYGANDVFTMSAVPEALRRIVALHALALPKASVLIVTPADRGLTKTFPPTLRVVAQRRALAQSEGWPLWDQFAAMGGEDSMRGFVRAGLAFGDAIHFTESGGEWMGTRLSEALLEGFEKYLAEHPSAGCRETLAP